MGKQFKLTQDWLQGTFSYDESEGLLRWKSGSGEEGDQGTQGTQAGELSDSDSAADGYLYVIIKVKGSRYRYKHYRLVYMWNGLELPRRGSAVDHINHNKSDDRLANLRTVTIAENNKNRPRSKLNNSGTSGVVFVTAGRNKGRWSASISDGSRWGQIGVYDKKEHAVLNRKLMEVELGYHENHGEYDEGDFLEEFKAGDK